jgi:hypothetical protein
MEQQGRVQPQRHVRVLRSRLHGFVGRRDVQRLRRGYMGASPQTSARSGATCHHGPRRSSSSAARCQGAGAAYELDLFRSCSDVEAAAVDLEADIPPGLDDDAVESWNKEQRSDN